MDSMILLMNLKFNYEIRYKKMKQKSIAKNIL